MKIENLNQEQREAATALEPRVVVIAGPGSGKTRTLVTRIGWLIEQGTRPEQIVAITFTNAGAREMESRLTPQPGEPVMTNGALLMKRYGLGHCGTLHSFALRMLREYGGNIGYGARTSIISAESAQDLLEAHAKRFNSKTPVKELLKLKASYGMRPPPTRRTVDETVIESYLDELRTAGIVDFDAILSEFLRLLNPITLAGQKIAQRFTHMHVDEVQDSNPIDWAIYRALPIDHKWYCGDPDQAIYGFRGGAVVELMREAQAHGTRLLKLEQNYRCARHICAVANRLISHNVARLAKETISAVDTYGTVTTDKPALNEGEELAQVGQAIRHLLDDLQRSPEQIAVLCRTNAIAGAYQRTLAAWKLPVKQREHTSLPRDWKALRAHIEHLASPENDTLAFLYLVANQEDMLKKTPLDARKAAHEMRKQAQAAGKTIRQAFLGLVPANPRVLGPTISSYSQEAKMLVAERVRELPPDATMADLALALAGQAEPTKETGEGIEVLTVHGAKGREWETVFIVGLEDEGWPGTRRGTDVEEERRLAFVAVTRARIRLHLHHASSRVATFGTFQKIEDRTPSRFLTEMKGTQ